MPLLYVLKRNNCCCKNSFCLVEAEIPPGMSEEEIEAHIMGVVLIENFNTKKGIDVFGNRAETTVMK